MDLHSVSPAIHRMMWMGCALISTGIPLAGAVDDFMAEAGARHGKAGVKAARFLVVNMPSSDKESLDADFLTKNLDLAFKARAEFPWAAAVPEDIFLNDVLPYAVFDEARDPWRAEMLELARPMVAKAETAAAAAQALNRGIFERVNVRYHTGRRVPNQSARESMASGRASCTGLSILLVNACRAVGIPARAVGTQWTSGRGNHTWVEIWDGGWHFTGAGEYDPKGLNRAWFVEEAAKARTDDPRHAVYATSWKREGLAFPMVWAPRNQQVAAVDVTSRYAAPEAGGKGAVAAVGIRLFAKRGGERIVAKVVAVDGEGKASPEKTTRAGTADLNDMPVFSLEPGTSGRLVFTTDGGTRIMRFGPLDAGDATIDAIWEELDHNTP